MNLVWKLVWRQKFAVREFYQPVFLRQEFCQVVFLRLVSQTLLRLSLGVCDLRVFVRCDSRTSACFLRGEDQIPRLRRER